MRPKIQIYSTAQMQGIMNAFACSSEWVYANVLRVQVNTFARSHECISPHSKVSAWREANAFSRRHGGERSCAQRQTRLYVNTKHVFVIPSIWVILHVFLTKFPYKRQRLNSRQETMYQLVHYSEVPLYNTPDTIFKLEGRICGSLGQHSCPHVRTFRYISPLTQFDFSSTLN